MNTEEQEQEQDPSSSSSDNENAEEVEVLGIDERVVVEDEEEEEEEAMKDDVKVDANPTATTTTTTTISYKVVQNQNFENVFVSYQDCNMTERNNASPLFTQDAIFNFQAQISTSLKVLIMGDSVGIQYSQALQEAAGASHDHRKVLRYTWGLHEGINLASPVRGGGAVAGWRITGIFRQEQMNNNQAMPNDTGGGWMEYDVKKIRRALAAMSPSKRAEEEDSSLFCDIQEDTARKRTTPVQPAVEEDPDSGCAEENFDVVVHVFPFSWMKKPTIKWFTFDMIDEAVQLSRKQFGAKIVVLQTIPVQNNVVDMVSELQPINDAIINYSDSYETNRIKEVNDNSGEELNEMVETVLLLDVARLSYELFTQNAASLGLITNDTVAIQEALLDNSINQILNPLLTQRTKCCNPKYPQIVGFTCSDISSLDETPDGCTRSRYTRDGMHWCMEEVGGRINGGLACLLKCVEHESESSDIRSCEKQCNDQFMSLTPVTFE
mmetsp:Transcript_18837/g.28227  ORF Transcript_18837/g.28227 Transcript_18837/m.28227 type:complete len:494 (+) Transcript_18837:93-1574(+)